METPNWQKLSPENKAWWNYKLQWEERKTNYVSTASDKEADIGQLSKVPNVNEFALLVDDKLKREFHPSYKSYIKPDVVTNLQVPLSTNSEERVFLLVHQMYELAFKQMIFDFDVVAKTLYNLLNETENFRCRINQNIPVHYEEYNNLKNKTSVERGHSYPGTLLFWQPAYFASQRLVVNAEKVLAALSSFLDITTFSGMEFAQFRPLLLPASGFQGEQFRTIQKILGKNAVVELQHFGMHEYHKKYKAEPEAWKKLSEQKTDVSKEFFKEVINPVLHERKPDPGNKHEDRDWEKTGAGNALGIVDTVTALLEAIGKQDTSEVEIIPSGYYKDDLVHKCERLLESFMDEYLREADPLKPPKAKNIETQAEMDERTAATENAEELKKIIKERVKNVKTKMEEYLSSHLTDLTRKGMQVLVDEHRDTFLLHILKNLSVTDTLIHAMDYSKRNRERALRKSILQRPYFSFLERHIDFIDNHISIVMEHAQDGSNERPPISGSGGGGKNYLEFAMRLYELFPAFPAVNEHIVK